jgi:formylglycine-generating enzyme required for sulfatase activity
MRLTMRSTAPLVLAAWFAWLPFAAAALPIDDAAAPPPPAKPSTAATPATPAPLDLADLGGTWNLQPGSVKDLRLQLRIDRRARAGDCAITTSSPQGIVEQSCTISRSGNRIRIVGRVTSSSIAGAVADTLVATVDRGEMTGSLESRHASDVKLFLEGSAADAAAKAAAAKVASAAAAQAEAARAGQDAARIKALTPELVTIPAGTFSMGSPWSESGRSFSEAPQHTVQVKSFELSKYPVTFEQWDGCVADGGCNAYQPIDQGWGRGRQPVINVSWDDAQAYVAWLSAKTKEGFRLPSEAEWEYAARAGSTTARYWGEAIGSGNANCNGCGGPADPRRAAPVGSFKPNAFGLHDMLGNVWQLTQDCWRDNYRDAAADAAPWQGAPNCSQRIVRGGSWIRDASFARSAERLWVAPTDRNYTLGFRVARSVP